MPQQQSPSQNDPGTSDFVWLTIIGVIVIVVVWYFFQNQITYFVYKIKYYELWGLQQTIHGWNWLVAYLKVPFLRFRVAGIEKLLAITRDSPETVSIPALQALSTSVGNYLRVIIAPILIIFGFIIFKTNIQLKLKTIFNMNKMRVAEKNNWPQIQPVVKLNLVEQDIDQGEWAMSIPPMNFCKKYRILKEKKDDHGKPAVDLIKDRASQVFVSQLGPLWTNAMALPIHARALFAIFAACGNHEQEAAFELLHDIARSASQKKLDFTGTDQLLVKYFNTKLVIRVLQKHAYVTTVFMSMLELARTDGVLATSEFLWLKPLDRRLWYVLNTVGRYTALPEVAGPYAQWLAEKKWGGPLRTPMIEEATHAMESALKDILYEPEED